MHSKFFWIWRRNQDRISRPFIIKKSRNEEACMKELSPNNSSKLNSWEFARIASWFLVEVTSYIFHFSLPFYFPILEYRLISKKGEGTFSEVLKAQSIKTGKYVAIKCMKNHFDTIEQVSGRYEADTWIGKQFEGNPSSQAVVASSTDNKIVRSSLWWANWKIGTRLWAHGHEHVRCN